MVTSFIDAARSIIDSDGIGGVSIRKVASKVGCSSAALYLYFWNLNGLLALSTITYFKDCCKDLAAIDRTSMSDKGCYYTYWTTFCHSAFAHPRIFEHFFFEGEPERANKTAKRYYYSIYPQELATISDTMLDQMMPGDPFRRNYRVLEACAHSLGYTPKETKILNDITVSFYHAILRRVENLKTISLESLCNQFISAVTFITEPCDLDLHS